VGRGYISIKVRSDDGAERAMNDADVSIVLAKIPTADKGTPAAMPRKRRFF